MQWNSFLGQVWQCFLLSFTVSTYAALALRCFTSYFIFTYSCGSWIRDPMSMQIMYIRRRSTVYWWTKWLKDRDNIHPTCRSIWLQVKPNHSLGLSDYFLWWVSVQCCAVFAVALVVGKSSHLESSCIAILNCTRSDHFYASATVGWHQ